MLRASATSLLLIVTLALAACGGDDDLEPVQPAKESGKARNFAVEEIATGLNRPTYVGAAPGDADGLYVLEQPGRVLRVDGKERRTLLDLRSKVLLGAEQGLLGIAFHPGFAENRRLYLHFSDKRGDTRVEERKVTGDGTIAKEPVRELLFVDQPEENHNGGQLAFGPDGRLYLGLGDGGGAFDPERRAQDADQLLGKVVSADVDAPKPNWRVDLTGLRNPWRFSFDPAMGEIWIADVGQDKIEEVNRVLIEPDEPPKNLGWSQYEGTRKIKGEGRELRGGGEVVWPAATYSHDEGCSVTGGYVYSGTRIPALTNRYLYGDFCSGAMWTLEAKDLEGGAEDVRREQAVVPQLTSIGADGAGEPVFASATGALYRAVPAGS